MNLQKIKQDNQLKLEALKTINQREKLDMENRLKLNLEMMGVKVTQDLMTILQMSLYNSDFMSPESELRRVKINVISDKINKDEIVKVLNSREWDK